MHTPDAKTPLFPVAEEHIRWAIELQLQMGAITEEEAASRLAAVTAQVREGLRDA